MQIKNNENKTAIFLVLIIFSFLYQLKLLNLCDCYFHISKYTTRESGKIEIH